MATSRFLLIINSQKSLLVISMVITFYGENCFKFQVGDTSVLTDPVDSKSGLSSPRFKYDALIKTLSLFPPEEKGEELAIFGPGEYNFKDITVSGFLLENEVTEKILKTVYVAQMEDIKFGIMGHLAEMPQPSVMEHLEEIDVLILPGGGKPFIDQKHAVKLIRQIQPKIVIPTFFKVPGLKRQADDLKEFLEEFNHGKREPQEKLTIKKKDLAGMKPSQLVVLKI